MYFTTNVIRYSLCTRNKQLHYILLSHDKDRSSPNSHFPVQLLPCQQPAFFQWHSLCICMNQLTFN